jgi:regulator of sirC expression with transglutaminase-like and TPR domain
MSISKRARLQRLVRVVELIYRRESAELARRHFEAREAGEFVIEAEQRLDAPLAGGDFLSQLSVVRAAQARRKQIEADMQFRAQLGATMDAMSKKKGAEGELHAYAIEVRDASSRREEDELLERIAQSPKASLGQGL